MRHAKPTRVTFRAFRSDFQAADDVVKKDA